MRDLTRRGRAAPWTTFSVIGMAVAALGMATLLSRCTRDPEAESRDGGLGSNAKGYCEPMPTYTESVSACPASPDDYQPRAAASALDTWPACISDDNDYHVINPSISTVARVAAFEEIARRLWADNRLPSVQDFVDARVLYAQDQGLDSRVQRREDVHFEVAPEPCSSVGIPEQYPDRCVGPAKLLPILNDAFARGAQGDRPAVQAGRIEAALVWFLYVSVLSEVRSCTTKPQDCDSAWAYYSGGEPRDAPLGLARMIRALGSATHDRAYDGVLAVRCWRNLDNETGTANNLTLRDRAGSQLDRAMLRGLALIVRQRVTELRCSQGDVLDARWAFLTTLAPFLDRAARERLPSEAEVLARELSAADPSMVDVERTVGAIDALFPCP
ncbi:MAG: hypothetical protein IPK13_05075 [Deltaproteobacteria bacterium]|nr:hypothetical protein [Deltaproteobacteria bacterium]